MILNELTLRGLHCLFELIITEKGLNKEAFKNKMPQVWKLEGWVSFKEVCENCYLIEFQKSSEKTKILQGRPWFFDSLVLTLQEYDGGTSPMDILLSHEPLCVQIHNHPLVGMY